MSLVSFGMLIKIPPRSSCNPSSSSFLHGPFLLLLQPITSDLQDNKLEGTIPQSLYELRSLRSLRLEGNAFTQTSTLTIEETDEWKIVLNGNGARLKWWKNKSGTPEHIDFHMTTRAIWKRRTNPIY